jgi:hypothetical protein
VLIMSVQTVKLLMVLIMSAQIAWLQTALIT